MLTWQKCRKYTIISLFLTLLILLILIVSNTNLYYGSPCFTTYNQSDLSRHYLHKYQKENLFPLVLENSKNLLAKRNLKLKYLLNKCFNNIVKGIPAKDEYWCERMSEGKLDDDELRKLKKWRFTITIEEIINNEENLNNKCNKIKEMFLFIEKPLSYEELNYPLAYGIIVYKSAFQVYMMISAIYQPQNLYCIMVDEKSNKEFKNSILLLAECFPNIIFKSSVIPIGWCEYGVAHALYNCLKYLTEINHNWKYFQYMSGFDLPLKTNLEMVRIFKQLNRTVNMAVYLYPNNRLGKEVKNIKPPLPLWKSSMSSLFPREAANEMIENNKVHELMKFLEYTVCSDETIWATVAGNPEELKISGGFNASAFFNEEKECIKNNKGNNINEIIKKQLKLMTDKYPNETFYPDNYYISRYQVWSNSKINKCYGTWSSGSCVFGINDINILIKRPELVQHKMYLYYQPAAYFCLWKTIYERALDWRKQKKFKAKAYSQLPTVKYLKEGNKHFFDEQCLLSLWDE